MAVKNPPRRPPRAKRKPNAKAAKVTIQCADLAGAKRAFADLEAIVDGVYLARDLVNEPANMLGPVELADQAPGTGRMDAEFIQREVLVASQRHDAQ